MRLLVKIFSMHTPTILGNDWFTEIDPRNGSAFSLQLGTKVFAAQSPYQKIEVYETTHYGKLLVLDGCTMLSSKDNFIYHEMLAHPGLFTHPNPQRVAIIGGGDCGTLHEVLKHPEVTQAVQIDIDEMVTQVALEHFPELCASNQDSRAQLLFIDGIEWMKNADPGSLDVIIVDATDPLGPGEVLFTADFFQSCQRALRDDGLLIQQSESPIGHSKLIQDMYQHLQQNGFQAIQTLFFPQPIYPTGWWSATMGSKQADFAPFRATAVRQKKFTTRYYNADIHQAAFAQPEFFRELISNR